MKWIIYTDLDGTLLDFKTYSFKVTQSTIEHLNAMDIPVIFCSSKTRVEQEVYRSAMNLQFPFIVENGSAIFIPEAFFEFELEEFITNHDFKLSEIDGYFNIALGADFTEIRQVIEKAKAETGIQLEGYADLSLNHIMALTGLDEEAAKRAAKRDFSETILRGINESDAMKRFLNILEAHDLQCVSGGKFQTVMGKNSDKGKAIQILNKLLQKQYGEIKTIGLGDSANDLPLLEAVDFPFLVQKPSGEWQDVDNPNVQKVDAIGPQGWNLAICTLLNF